jgi:hypothetical protein
MAMKEHNNALGHPISLKQHKHPGQKNASAKNNP